MIIKSRQNVISYPHFSPFFSSASKPGSSSSTLQIQKHTFIVVLSISFQIEAAHIYSMPQIGIKWCPVQLTLQKYQFKHRHLIMFFDINDNVFPCDSPISFSLQMKLYILKVFEILRIISSTQTSSLKMRPDSADLKKKILKHFAYMEKLLTRVHWCLDKETMKKKYSN